MIRLLIKFLRLLVEVILVVVLLPVILLASLIGGFRGAVTSFVIVSVIRAFVVGAFLALDEI